MPLEREDLSRRFANKEHSTIPGTLTELFDFTRQRLERHSFDTPFFIGISGTSGSGKSKISSVFADHLSARFLVGLFDMDVYLDDKDKEKVTPRDDTWPPFVYCGYDPAVFNLPVVREDLLKLTNNISISLPIYDRHAHMRVGSTVLTGKDIYIVDGMRALDDEIATLTDINCLVKASFSTRLMRRIVRNIVEFKRTDIDALIQRYITVTEPGYIYYEPYLENKSDFILLNEDDSVNTEVSIDHGRILVTRDGNALVNLPISSETETILHRTSVNWF